MTRARTLNTLLSINAALLATVAWLQLADSPGLGTAAVAQSPPREGGIPNAGGQRERMINELEAIRASVDGLKKAVEGGKMKITIGNIEELKAAVGSNDGQGK